MAWAVTADVERYDEAVEWFKRRKVVVSPEMHGLVAREAFWVGNGLQLHQIENVFGKIDAAIESGESFADWRKQVREELKNDAHAETVFRNAVQRSYNAGRYEQMRQPDVLRFRPFWMFDAILDARSSDICPICDGTILDADDPWWLTHTPPLHHRCRSSHRNLRRSEAERRGISKAAPNTDDVRAPGDWGAAPGTTEGWKPKPVDKGLQKELKRKTKQRLPRPVPKGMPEPVAPPTPAPTGVRIDAPTAKRLLDSLSGQEWDATHYRTHFGYGQEVRTWVQSTLADHGITPNRPNLGLFVDDTQLAKANADAVALTTGDLEGLTAVERSYFGRLKSELRQLANGKAVEFPALRVLIHEEIHLASRADVRSYDGQGIDSLIEEVTTELSAQRIAHRAGAFKESLGIAKMGQHGPYFLNRPIAYAQHIVPVVQDVAEVLGVDVQTALERITDAGIAMRTEKAQGEAHFEEFLRLIQVDNEAQRDKLREYLEIRKLKE